MRLAVCCVTCDPIEQVRAALGPLRPLADEIVIGYDDRVDAELRDAYAALADRVFPVSFQFVEHHLADLHAACRSDWLLRIDTDEVPSDRLVARLATLVPEPGVRQYAIPRRWIDPDAHGWLDEAPWYPDYQTRLVRADDQLDFSGELHSGPTPVEPVVFLEEPLYHLDCVVSDRAKRQEKALLYDVQRVGLVTEGGLPLAAFYDPEEYAQGAPACLPEDDHHAIAAALRMLGRRDSTLLAPTPDVSPARLSAGDGEAQIEILERDLRLYTDRQRRLSIKITNRSAMVWPASRPSDPHPISLAYRLRGPDGVEHEGMRTPLMRDLAPGASVVLPAHIAPVPVGGSVELELDMVQEHVRWFGAGCVVRTQAGPGYFPMSEREARPKAAGLDRIRALRGRGMRIPRVIHSIWIGDDPLSDEHARFGETWRELHPEWEYKLWTEEDVPAVPAAQRARNVAERADVLRYEILRRHGGVYVDVDVECLRPLDDLLTGVEVFAAYEVPGRLCNAVMGGVAHHPALNRLCDLVARTAGRGHYPEATATVLLTRAFEPLPDVTLFSAERFYPYLWDQSPADAEITDGTYAVHHWAKSWLEAGVGSVG
jgi:hypothetical protein